MASYSAAEALDLILGSTEDLDSGDDSDIQEDPLFPLPRHDDSGDDSEEDGEQTDECEAEPEEDETESENEQDAGRIKNILQADKNTIQ